MKRIVSLLVAVALIMSMSVTAFAAGESQTSAVDVADPDFFSQVITEGGSCWFTYTAERSTKVTIGNYSSTEFTAVDAAGNPITIDVVEDPWFGPSYSAVIEVAAGETAVWQVTTTAQDYYYCDFSTEGESSWPYVATVGSHIANIPEYGRVYYVYTPDADGVLTLTIDTDTTSDWFYSMGADDGWGYPGADANGAIRSDDSDLENDDLESEWYPNGHNPSRTIDVVAGVAYALEISNVSGNAGQVAFTLSTEPGAGGEPGGEPGGNPGGNPGGGTDTPDDIPENGIAIESYGNAEWTAPEDGYVKFTINIPGATLAVLNENFSPLGEDTETVTVQVTAGATYGIYPAFVTTASIVTWEYVDAPAGGDSSESIPSGSALALGDNNVELTYATMPMMAPYWTYTATEDGNLTVTVASIDGASGMMLGMPFGMGTYTLVVGETDGMGTNTATVPMSAGQSVNIAVLDRQDMNPVPAVLNLSFQAGQVVPEKNPADFFAQDANNNYIIDSLANPVEIFVGNNDINYIYVAESAGVVTVTPTVDGMAATNCWIYHNDVCDTSAAPVTVAAGDVVLINVWGGYEGTVTLTEGAGGGDEIESAPMSGENVAVSADETLEIYYTPDADGVLTIDISATPGYSVLVQNAATEDVVGLPSQSAVAEATTYELEAGVEYKITLTGFDLTTWDVAAATITYNITFGAGQGSSTPVDIDKADVELALGEQNVDLLENTIVTLFDFVPETAGTYKITVPANVTLGTYGFAYNLIEAGENGVLEIVATAAEQTTMIGLTADTASVNVKIEKIADYEALDAVTKIEYESTVTVDSDFEMPEGDVVAVDITKPQTVVYGNDGYYHLGSFNGPILYVNLNSDIFVLANMNSGGGATQFLGAQFKDENGKLCVYDYLPMMSSNYYDLSRVDDYYPMNDDLVMFFADYGIAQGWYTKGLSPIDAVNDGTVVPESAWLAFASYIEGNNGTATDGEIVSGDKEEVKPEAKPEADNSKTGDFGVITAAIALGMSAICGTAVIAKKKEN